MRLASGLIVAVLCGCGPPPSVGPPPTVPITEASRLCEDPGLGPGDFCMPGTRMERLMRSAPFQVLHVQDAPSGISGPKKVQIRLLQDDGPPLTVFVKWKQVPNSGDKLNNSPRRELAAYQFQKLFLEEDSWVVPPSVVRCIDRTKLRLIADAKILKGTRCVLSTLSYWVQDVTNKGTFDEPRLATDPPYRLNFSRLNLVTHLIGHRDTRDANFLMASDPRRPRLLSVDNGLAFSGLVFNPIAWFQHDWADLLVDEFPRSTIERIRKIRRVDLNGLLAVAHLRQLGDMVLHVSPAAPFDEDEGVRFRPGEIQLGLTRDELDGIEERRAALLTRIDDPDDDLRAPPMEAR
jgi:hypothetical protein